MVKRTWCLLAAYVERPRRAVVGLVLCAAGASALEALSLLMLAHSALLVTGAPSQSPITVNLGTALATGISAVVGAAGLYLVVARRASQFGAEVLATARYRVVAAYLKADWPTQQVRPSGELQESVSTLATQSSQVAAVLAQALASGCSLLTLTLVGLVVSPAAMLGVAVLGSILLVLFRPIARRTHELAEQFVSINSSASEDLGALASAATEIRLFGVTTDVLERVEVTVKRVSEFQAKTRFAALAGSFLYRELALLLLIGGVAVLAISNPPGLGVLGAVVLISIRSLGYASATQSQLQSLRQYSPSLFLLEDRIAALAAGARAVPSESVNGEGVMMTGVTFSYGQSDDCIGPITLSVARGEIVGLIGASGGGKSTALKLLLGLIEPKAGRVALLGSHPSRTHETELSRRVAYVPQSPRLVPGTVLENVRFHRSWIDDGSVGRACQLAGLGDETVPLGKVVGRDGSDLSGGQAQRVAIARALAGRPDVLLLDEPTSALDSETEQVIRTTIDGLRGRVSVVLVAHRAETTAVCDRVVRMVDSRIEAIPSTLHSVQEVVQ